MKRRSHQPRKRRDRKAGQSPYQRYGKIEHSYACGRYHPLSPAAKRASASR